MKAKPEELETAAVYAPIADLHPWEDNPRNNEGAVSKVAESIKRFGFGSPIIARKANGMIIAGHTRWLASQSLGLDKVPVRYLDLDEVDAKLLAISDNSIGEIAEWEPTTLAEQLDELKAHGVDLDVTGWGEDKIDEILDALPDALNPSQDSQYTAKIETPVYEIQGDRPAESELYDTTKSQALIDRIKASEIDPEIELFLLAAAARHTSFRYDRIAEYYAHAGPEIQELMEDSALVIIDFEKAIEAGFVKMSKAIAEAVGKDYASE